MSDEAPFPLARELSDAGAVPGPSPSGPLPRHFGDPGGEFHSAVSAAAVIDRSHRTRMEVFGKAPRQMLKGIVTGTVPGPMRSGGGAFATGRGSYSAVLTPKGRIVTDLRLFSRSGAEETFVLDVPPAGADPLREHFGRFLPPRMARVRELTADTAMITVLGPLAATTLADAVGMEPGVEAGIAKTLATWLERSEDLDCGVVNDLLVCRTEDVSVPAYDVVGEVDGIRELWRRLVGSGVRPVGQSAWQVLRVEAGRPEFGVDMTEATLLPEAGIVGRAVDHGKGCYTGQEVVVRVRDRGHVNQHLRGLVFGSLPTPPAGTELYAPGDDRPRGRVTSAVASPRFGRTIGLGYVRREIEPPARLRVGAPDGPPVDVLELAPATWRP